MRKSITFNKDVEDAVEDYRRKAKPIPTFTKAVNDLLKKALKVGGG